MLKRISARLRTMLLTAAMIGVAATGLTAVHAPAAHADDANSYLGWYESYSGYGPCINGSWSRIGTVSVDPNLHRTGWMFKKTTYASGGYYKTEHYLMEGVTQAVKYKICTNGAYTRAYYSTTAYAHRWRYNEWNCIPGSCRHLYSSETDWRAGRVY